MPRDERTGRVLRLCRRSLVLTVVVIVAACGDTTPTTDPQVSAVRGAAGAMAAASNFTFSGDVVAGTHQVHLQGRFSQPGSVSETVTIGADSEDFIILGTGAAYERVAPATTWTKVARPSATTTDPRAAFTELSAVESVIQTGQSYSFTLSGNHAAALVAGSAAVSGVVTLSDGQISDLTYKSVSPAVSVHLSYSGTGVSAAVTAPPG